MKTPSAPVIPTPSPRPRPEAVSFQDAAVLWNVSERTIRRLIHAGRLKATRVGRQWRIVIADLRHPS